MFCKVEHIDSINMSHSNVIGVLHMEYGYYFPFLFNQPHLQDDTRFDCDCCNGVLYEPDAFCCRPANSVKALKVLSIAKLNCVCNFLK